MQKIGFVGLGNMGEGMAWNLATKGFSPTVRDVRKEPVDRMVAVGATAANTNFEVGQKSDIVCLAVFDEAQVMQTCLPHEGDPGVLAGMQAGGIIAIHSTVSPNLSQKLAALAAERSIKVIDAPMTGGADVAAKAGKLTFFVGGDEEAYVRCRPAFEAMTQHLFYVGPLGSGAITKILSNFLAISNVLLVREALRLARTNQIDEQSFLTAINAGGVGASWPSNNWLKIRTQEENYTTGKAGMVTMAGKDMHLAKALASETGTSMPVLSFLVEHALPELGNNGLTR